MAHSAAENAIYGRLIMLFNVSEKARKPFFARKDFSVRFRFGWLPLKRASLDPCPLVFPTALAAFGAKKRQKMIT